MYLHHLVYLHDNKIKRNTMPYNLIISLQQIYILWLDLADGISYIYKYASDRYTCDPYPPGVSDLRNVQER